MPLTDRGVQSAKATGKLYRLSDGNGLVLEVGANGGRRWRHRFHFDGRELMLSLGTYPAVSLKEARARRDEERRLLSQGVNPSEHRKKEAADRRQALANTFEALANEWYAKNYPHWSESSRNKARYYLDSDLIPQLGDRPVAEITREDVLNVLRNFEARSAFNVRDKARGWLSQIFKMALVKGVVQYNPAADLEVLAAKGPRPRRHASVTLGELPDLLRAVHSYTGHPTTRYALQLLTLTAARPGELRKAYWQEFDFERQLWVVPAERMKVRREHVVPLPRQAIQILRELHPITSYSPLVFPSRSDRNRPISENTLNNAMRRQGYKGKQTGHGFRHLISTALNERGFNRDWIERQLAHGDTNAIRAIYNQAEYLDDRRAMMQAWADYLDELRS